MVSNLSCESPMRCSRSRKVLALALEPCAQASLESCHVGVVADNGHFHEAGACGNPAAVAIVFVDALRGIGAETARLIFSIFCRCRYRRSRCGRRRTGLSISSPPCWVSGLVVRRPSARWGLAIAESGLHTTGVVVWTFGAGDSADRRASSFGDGLRDLVEPRLRLSR